jgi:hypothetical protein
MKEDRIPTRPLHPTEKLPLLVPPSISSPDKIGTAPVLNYPAAVIRHRMGVEGQNFMFHIMIEHSSVRQVHDTEVLSSER